PLPLAPRLLELYAAAHDLRHREAGAQLIKELRREAHGDLAIRGPAIIGPSADELRPCGIVPVIHSPKNRKKCAANKNFTASYSSRSSSSHRPLPRGPDNPLRPRAADDEKGTEFLRRVDHRLEPALDHVARLEFRVAVRTNFAGFPPKPLRLPATQPAS